MPKNSNKHSAGQNPANPTTPPVAAVAADADQAARQAAAAFDDRRVLAPASVAEFNQGLMDAAAAALDGAPPPAAPPPPQQAAPAVPPVPAVPPATPGQPPQAAQPAPPVQQVAPAAPVQPMPAAPPAPAAQAANDAGPILAAASGATPAPATTNGAAANPAANGASTPPPPPPGANGQAPATNGAAQADNGAAPAQNGQAPSQEEAARRLRALKDRFHQTLGEAVMLMAGHPRHEHAWLMDLKHGLLPALALHQFKIVRGPADQTIGFISWAKLSERAEERLKKSGRLRPADWDSGDRVVLVDVIAPNNQAEQALAQKIRADVFENIPIKRLRRGPRKATLEPIF